MNSYGKNKKNGVSVIIVFLIMAICLSVVLGISTILTGQARIMNDMGNSVRAIYIGDSGIEKTLYYDKSSSIISQLASWLGQTPDRGVCGSVNLGLGLVGGNLSRPIQTDCDSSTCTDCTMTFSGNLPNGNTNAFTMKVVISSKSTTTDSLFQSTGAYNGTSRLIELDILK